MGSLLVAGQQEDCLPQANPRWLGGHLYNKRRRDRLTKHHANSSGIRGVSRVESRPAGSFVIGQVGDTMGECQTERHVALAPRKQGLTLEKPRKM